MVKRRKTNQATNAVVAYHRVSTAAQGRSGLGLEAQEAAVKAYCLANGCEVDSVFQEEESGKRSDRPELAKALERAERIGARLVFAKLDRLARNARFLLGIVESGVDVVFCDFPTIPAGPTGKFMLTQMAAVAELEAGLISERTKAALTAYKARGGLLGGQLEQCRNLTDEARQKGAKAAGAANRAAAIDDDAELAARMLEMERSGMSLRQIAKAMNDEGQATRNDGTWSHIQVGRILDRAYGKRNEQGVRPGR